MSDLETRLPDALRDVVPDDVPRPGLVTRVPALARRRRLRTRLAAGAAAAAVVTAVAGLFGVGGLRLQEAAPAGPPPAVDRSGPYLYFVSESVPVGGTAHFFVVNPTGTTFDAYGVIGSLERWTADGWEDAGRFAAALGDVPGGRVVEGDDELSAPAIGLGALARSGGDLESVDVTGLEPGWYRFGHDAGGRVAHGLVQVLRDARPAGPEPVPPASPVRLDMSTVVLSGQPTTVPVRLTVPAATSVEAAVEGRGAVVPEALVQRWDGEGWGPDDDAGPVPLRVEGVAGDVEADLPVLAPGTYRLVVRTSTQSQVWAPFWVLDLP